MILVCVLKKKKPYTKNIYNNNYVYMYKYTKNAEYFLDRMKINTYQVWLPSSEIKAIQDI